ncbi:MAG: MarR family winged helix-turn-helix transcriptional regulator [Opitutales bacterium]
MHLDIEELSRRRHTMDEASGVRVYLILWKAFKAMEAVDRASLRAVGFPSLSDFSLLEVLLHKGPLPVNEIGRRVFLTSGSITSAVDRGVRQAWVERRSSPADRRVVVVHLTTAGREVIEGAFGRHARALEKAASPLEPAERVQLVALLKKLGHHAASVRSEIEAGEDAPGAAPQST